MAGPAWAVAADPVLTVSVVGSGSVTSAPAGIDCGASCSAAYPRQRTGAPQTVVLNAHPATDQAFVGWSGACSGAGDCTVVMNADETVSATFASKEATTPAATTPASTPPASTPVTLVKPTGPPPPLAVPPTLPVNVPGAEPDADHDGVPNATDRCPSTAAGAKVGPDGCAALDLIRDPATLTNPLTKATAAATPGMSSVPGASKPLRALRRSQLRLIAAIGRASAGDLCGLLPAVRGADRGVQAAVRGIDTSIATETARLRALPHAANEGDADDADIKGYDLHGHATLFAAVAAASADAAKREGAACHALGKHFRHRGTITDIDDASGTLTLGGTTFLLARTGSGDRVAVGSVATIAGSAVKAAPDLITAVTLPASASKPDGLKVSPCFSFRIAPVQDFSRPNLILQDPRGYETAPGLMRLERGTRLAATSTCPAGPKTFSLSIDEDVPGSDTPVSIASDLRAGDEPVLLPHSSSPAPRTIHVHFRAQGKSCGPVATQARAAAYAPNPFPCPITEERTVKYIVKTVPAGAVAQAKYSQTTFGLEDIQMPVDVTLTGFTPAPDAALPANTKFQAEGFTPTGNQATGVLKVVDQGGTFALWDKAYYGWNAVKYQSETFGTNAFAGLFWPRMVGTRGGYPFRYSAGLPAIVTDAVSYCGVSGPACFYKLPSKLGDDVGVIQGNGPGAFSHNGAQRYAFDFDFKLQTPIYATRGGKVGDAVYEKTENFNPCNPDTPTADGPANYIRIDHEDGTYAYYVHLSYHGLAHGIGSVVKRGDLIGISGNTGRSCGPHLHFQVAANKMNTYYGQTMQIGFQAWIKGGSPFASEGYVPKSGDALISTNG
jgi:murein DD-endopeptidase MepM/ murein hydrolase activator NlpD